jgi:hypothetical protein
LFPSNTQQIALPAAGTSAKAHTSKVPASRSREPTARYKWLITQPRAEFAAIRMEHLAAHPTVKPVSLVADALLDCAARGDVMLDQFAVRVPRFWRPKKLVARHSGSNTSLDMSV